MGPKNLHGPFVKGFGRGLGATRPKSACKPRDSFAKGALANEPNGFACGRSAPESQTLSQVDHLVHLSHSCQTDEGREPVEADVVFGEITHGIVNRQKTGKNFTFTYGNESLIS